MECARPHDTKNDKSSNIGVLKCTTIGAVALLESISGNNTPKFEQDQSIKPSLTKEGDTSASEIVPYLRPPNDGKRGRGYGAWTVWSLLVCCIVGTAIKLPTWLEQIMSRINSSGVDEEKETKPAILTVDSNVKSESSNSPKGENEDDQQREGEGEMNTSNDLDKENNAVIICLEISQDAPGAESDKDSISTSENETNTSSSGDSPTLNGTLEEVEGGMKISNDLDKENNAVIICSEISQDGPNADSDKESISTSENETNTSSTGDFPTLNGTQEGEGEGEKNTSNEISQDAPGAESDKDSISTSESETNTSSFGDSPAVNGTKEGEVPSPLRPLPPLSRCKRLELKNHLRKKKKPKPKKKKEGFMGFMEKLCDKIIN